MSEKKSGGPAFPVAHDVQPEAGMVRSIRVEYGMTLRDYFAAKVAQGSMAAGSGGSPEEHAKWAYEVADAMLAERAK